MVLREVRLATLADAPYAFGSSLEEEQVLAEAEWRARAGELAFFVALDGDDAVGVAAGAQLREPDPSVRMLRSMWVSPPYRGLGVADALVDAVVEWARSEGATTLSLWATEHAQRARAFYVRLGFVPTGRQRPMGHGEHVAMAHYELSLAAPLRA